MNSTEEITRDVQLGSITVFTNSSPNGITIDEDVAAAISTALARYFTKRMKEKGIENVVVSQIETRIGCAITTLILTGIAAATAGWKFLAEYKAVKDGLIELANDFQSLWVKISKKKTSGPSKVEVEIYQSMPDAYKKYFTAGQDIVFIEGDEIIDIEPTALMREDILERPKEHKKKKKKEKKKEKKKH